MVLDEVAYWRSEESANPDVAVYNALAPGLVTLPQSILVGISTVYRRSGLLFEKYKKYFGQNDPDILVVHAGTRQFNPTIADTFIQQQLERDPEAASAEWLSQWRSDLADFV